MRFGYFDDKAREYVITDPLIGGYDLAALPNEERAADNAKPL
jgi:hypothetical protein